MSTRVTHLDAIEALRLLTPVFLTYCDQDQRGYKALKLARTPVYHLAVPLQP